jgi:hypothetical protein
MTLRIVGLNGEDVIRKMIWPDLNAALKASPRDIAHRPH